MAEIGPFAQLSTAPCDALALAPLGGECAAP
jgi:hypothetical protein